MAAKTRIPLLHDDMSSKIRDFYNLTSQEFKIISFMLEKMPSNRQISIEFGISEETVKRHLSNVFDKIGASTRLEMVLMILHKRHEFAVADLETAPVVVSLRVQVTELEEKLVHVESEKKQLLERVTFAENCVKLINGSRKEAG